MKNSPEQFNSKEYRDDLAEDLKESRAEGKEGKEKAREILEEAQETDEYQTAEKIEKEIREKYSSLSEEEITILRQTLDTVYKHGSNWEFDYKRFYKSPLDYISGRDTDEKINEVKMGVGLEHLMKDIAEDDLENDEKILNNLKEWYSEFTELDPEAGIDIEYNWNSPHMAPRHKRFVRAFKRQVIRSFDNGSVRSSDDQERLYVLLDKVKEFVLNNMRDDKDFGKSRSSINDSYDFVRRNFTTLYELPGTLKSARKGIESLKEVNDTIRLDFDYESQGFYLDYKIIKRLASLVNERYEYSESYVQEQNIDEKFIEDTKDYLSDKLVDPIIREAVRIPRTGVSSNHWRREPRRILWLFSKNNPSFNVVFSDKDKQDILQKVTSKIKLYHT